MKDIKMKTFMVLFLSPILLTYSGCKSESESNPLAPGSRFTGNWKSELPVEVIIQTDFCTGTLEDVAAEEWDVRWVITETGDPNVIEIKMTYTPSDYTVTNPACNGSAGYLREPQPVFMTGYVTNNTISVKYLDKEIFTVDYINNKLVGELSYSYCLGYCQKIYTEEDNFSIVEF